MDRFVDKLLLHRRSMKQLVVVEDAAARCWGMAYRVSDAQRAVVLAQLDHREKGGYDRRLVAVHPTTEEPPFHALIYIATPDNANYLGPAPDADIAATIGRSHGPSGTNRDYLLNLAGALEEHGISDPHVEALVALMP